MDVTIRPVTTTDVEECGRICYEAFKTISDAHNFRPDFATAESGVEFVGALVHNPNVFGVVAEAGGRVVGSNFLWEHDAVRAVGPITVTPTAQARGAGRKLMEAVVERGRGAEGVRLVQDTFNAASLSLYASLGFDVREPLVLIEGGVEGELPKGFEVRPVRAEDFEACGALCRKVHGFERTNELKATPPFLTTFVALRDGRVAAYASGPHFWALNHAVAETEDDMRALLTGAGSAGGGRPLSLVLPTRQSSLFRWCLSKGMRVVKPMTLMTMGRYEEPRGTYLPSVGY
ncbi:MAG TPA: GNAT family N-acetyltransferase [Pyrinomonadaceae bacterium]|jgi:predicted N-acetyltransferase YhbS